MLIPDEAGASAEDDRAANGGPLMQVGWLPEEIDFREKVRDWLEANLAGRSFQTSWSPQALLARLDWERCLHAAGYAGVNWPPEYGGAGLDPVRATIFYEEYERAHAPDRLNRQGLTLLGPTLMQYGTPEQKERWLPKILSCEHIWCQGFSEPDAGSDLASLRTRATADGDTYIVNGQKTWTSNARAANWIFALVRTDPDPNLRSRGISYLLIDLDTPGVEVRPIAQISGDSHFAEVFFSDVRVPTENRIGAENAGWRLAMSTLTFERGAGLYTGAHFQRILDETVAIMDWTGAVDDDWFRLEATRLQAAVTRYTLNHYALVSSPHEEDSGVLGPMNKLVWSTMQVQIYQLGIKALGSRVELGQEALPRSVSPTWFQDYWRARAALIYAGTNEIQRNILGERLLGLPREPKA